MNEIRMILTLSIRSATGDVVSQKSFTFETQKAYEAAFDTVRKCRELKNWGALPPLDALKTVEDALENLVDIGEAKAIASR